MHKIVETLGSVKEVDLHETLTVGANLFEFESLWILATFTSKESCYYGYSECCLGRIKI